MPSDYHQTQHELLTKAFADLDTWLGQYQHLLYISSLRLSAVGVDRSATAAIHINTDLNHLMTLLPHLPSATVDAETKTGCVEITIKVTTPAGLPVRLSSVLFGDEADELAEIAGLAAPRPATIPAITTDHLAAALTQARPGEANQ
ncbi:hypothetical protein [Crossiella sp. CA198]|uniref:hypothetical protein n=1 Tax=Crossiella sp. CA198 TaxID=3455607 RepID=UPI003F8D7719